MSSLGRSALFFALLIGTPAAGAQAIEVAPHRAFYELTLSRTEANSGVAGATGLLAVDWNWPWRPM